jgi:transposase-like protein
MDLDPHQAGSKSEKSSDSQEPADDAAPRCPHCGWQDVRRSHARTTLESVLSVFSIHRFRCRSCNHHFFAFRKRRAG